jgi:hypothetical protein
LERFYPNDLETSAVGNNLSGVPRDICHGWKIPTVSLSTVGTIPPREIKNISNLACENAAQVLRIYATTNQFGG